LNLLRRLNLAALAATAAVTLLVPAVAQSATAWPLRPPSTSGSFLAGQAAFSELNSALAARYLIEAARNDPDNADVVGRAVEALAAQGRVEDAADLAEHVLEIAPGDEVSAIIAAARSIKQRRYAAALKDLENVGLENFTGIAGTVLRAWAQIGAGEYDRALEALVPLEQAGLSNFLVFHKALMAEVAGDTSTALELAGKSLGGSTAPQPRLVEAVARILAHAGEFKQAEAVIAAFEAKGQSDPFVDRVKQELAEGRTPDPAVAGPDTGAGEVFNVIGLILASDGYSEISAIMLRLALYLNPAADNVTMLLGRLYEQSDRFDIATGLFEKIPEGSPLHGAAVVRIAANLASQGHEDEAIAKLQSIVAEDPTQLEALQALGNLLHADEKYDEAITVFTQLIEASGGNRPRDWIYFYSRAISYERSDHWPLAEADFLKALDLNPDEPRVLNYLGYSWVDRGENLERGLAMIEKAVAAQPNEGYIVDSLGWAYFRLGRYDEAVIALERAVRLDPSDANLNDHLGDAYWHVGRKREARFQWSIARALDEDGELADVLGDKLLNGLDVMTPPAA
jgi:tetratricopeptide (TPR) repeat protein